MSHNERPDDEHRPSPDALLAAEQQAQRAKLKIFLGAAAGVGKTYAMLEAAQGRLREGADVVVGVVETHGRPETVALLHGMEVIPRRRIDYRGHALEEMDLDGILARHPALVLVDELAHTNAPGSRHDKRYLDVEELLEAGISVYTTLNIQHVESLNDIVAQVTGVRVRETVPDRLIGRADELELVDLSAEALQQRLREGKVYVPDQARTAIRNFFRPGNLAALRELALRQTAQRVEQQMQTYMAAHAIPGPWAAAERVMVCITANPLSPRLVRTAHRLAESLRAPWLAVYVETPSHQHLSEADRDRISQTLRLAETLGGESVVIPGQDVAEELIRFARSRNVTQIIMGKSVRSRWSEIWRGSLTHDVIRRSGNVDVYITTGEEEAPRPVRRAARRFRPQDARAYLAAAAGVAAAALMARFVQNFFHVGDVGVLFLTAVALSAMAFGLWPSVFAAVASVLAYDYFFVPPLYTLVVGKAQDYVSLVVFLLMAVLISRLTSRLRDQAEASRLRETRTSALYAFSREIGRTGDLSQVQRSIVEQVERIFGADVVMLGAGAADEMPAVAYPPDLTLTDEERAAASWAAIHRHPSGRGSDTLQGISWFFLPLLAAHGTAGVLGVRTSSAAGLPPDQRRLLQALSGQAALALERVRLAEEVGQAQLLKEREQLQNTLLSSISHDLRTPLASILGAVTSLLGEDGSYDEASRTDLLATIKEEAERLNRFVGNLLDTTRIESGALRLNRDWTDISEVIGAALTRQEKALSSHRVVTDLGEPLPMLRLDFVLLEQVFVNLLDNAAKYSPAGTEIRIRSQQQARWVIVEVEDQGIGIPAIDIERIFDKFYRVQGADWHGAGTGLGLSICRGIIEAHGGTISATSPADPARGIGAVFTVRLPVEADAPAVASEPDGASGG